MASILLIRLSAMGDLVQGLGAVTALRAAQLAVASMAEGAFKGTGKAVAALLGGQVKAEWGYTSVGAKHADKRNLEMGFVTEDPPLVGALIAAFEAREHDASPVGFAVTIRVAEVKDFRAVADVDEIDSRMDICHKRNAFDLDYPG